MTESPEPNGVDGPSTDEVDGPQGDPSPSESNSTLRGPHAGMEDEEQNQPHRLTWKEGLFLVGPDPLTSPYYSSGALLVAGVGFTTPLFQIGLYSLLFLLAPLYIEAVLLTLSNGGTYVMTRYALSRFGKLAVVLAALVGIVISFSYVATAIVSMLSYSDYVSSLVETVVPSVRTLAALGLSAIPAIAFGVWVMPKQWQRVVGTVMATTVVAVVMSTVSSPQAVVMLAPLIMLFVLNNQGLRESVQVSKTIFLINLVVMSITIILGALYLIKHGVDLSVFVDGAVVGDAPTDAQAADEAHGDHGGHIGVLPGFAMLGAPLLLSGVGSSILGASGVESVMNIPEELERPRTDVKRIYMWMLGILLAIGGSLSVLLFMVLTPEQLGKYHMSLLAVLGREAVFGVTGNAPLAEAWKLVIVANAALMLIGATNTGFAGARGLWMTMARDNLLPRAVLRTNERGAFNRIHWMMLGAIFLLAFESVWNLPKLERWYGATFGLVMFSGMVAFILLRRFKANDTRLYKAPLNVRVLGTELPVAAIIGIIVLGYALLSMYSNYHGEIRELRTLVTIVGASAAFVLLLYNHRPLLRFAHRYYLRVIESVDNTVIETEDRTIVVAVGDFRVGRLLRKAISLARRQSSVTGIPYRQLVVFHMTEDVSREYVYEVTRESVVPAGISGPAIRVFTELAELVPSDLTCYIALVPPKADDEDRPLPKQGRRLHRALATLVEFHTRHHFKGHMVMVGTYGVNHEELESLQARLDGSTLVPVPLFDDS